MELNTQAVRDLLKRSDLYRLFVTQLGWDNPTDRPFTVEVGKPGAKESFTIKPLAQKREAYVFECSADSSGRIPEYAIRQQIEREARKRKAEHIIVFLDGERKTQRWQWVLREAGRPAAYREFLYNTSQSGETLMDKLASIRFRLSEEEELTITAVVERVTKGFDVERVTKKFYDVFSREQRVFCGAIQNIAEESREWYASLMLNRLMFVYFIQRQGFLDGDRDYLRHRLEQVQGRYGTGHYQEFYRQFLLHLFHNYLNRPLTERPVEAERYNDLIGRVPYLNGGLFEKHQIEEDNAELQIPDEAFERVFTFFDNYDWQLDDRPTRNDREINPDVLGYIFEKYINQKQMGAYYTKEDITGYIARNTILPFLFDAVAKQVPIALQAGSTTWQLLSDNPDRYIYTAVKSDAYLPTETEREYAARRTRYTDLRSKLAGGEVSNINDLITYNLDIVQFAQDVIEQSEGPELVRACYRAIAGRLPEQSNQQFQPGISVLDPTCGSGAFLFAALNILAPLYDACLRRMESFVEDELTLRPDSKRFADFLAIERRIEQHPNRNYFIYKSIIINNLYGVDIMPEAVEIARLRLFLKLASEVEYTPEQDNMGLEPLPDIDFNIVAGNTLVGYATEAEVELATRQQGKQLLLGMMGEGDAWQRIKLRLEVANEAYQTFRQQQMREFASDEDAATTRADAAEHKAQLRQRLDELTDELDQYLALQYGIYPNDKAKYKQWRKSHQPLHWLAEFYGIVSGGGFDVIIGNPPYVEYSKVRSEYTVKDYKTESCGNLYAFVMERALKLQAPLGRAGLIVLIGSLCTERMSPVQQAYQQHCDQLFLSTYSGHTCPGVLFVGVANRYAIWISRLGFNRPEVLTTNYLKWYSSERDQLFHTLSYVESRTFEHSTTPKLGSQKADAILRKLDQKKKMLGQYLRGSSSIWVYTTPIHWVKAFTFKPYFKGAGKDASTQLKLLSVEPSARSALICALNSSLFFWWWITRSDCYHLTSREIEEFPLDIGLLVEQEGQRIDTLAAELMADLNANSVIGRRNQKTTGLVEFQVIDPKLSKAIIDEIDRVLAQHYGFTDEELDFIINYDIKYRMGRNAEEE